MDIFSDDPLLFALARKLTHATGAPVLGGIAVHLHGYERTTTDIDLFADDAKRVAAALEAAGATWDPKQREFRIEGVTVHLVTAHDTGSVPATTQLIRGIKVVSLPDLIQIKLRSGLGNLARSKDLADVVELIRALDLDKTFASRLPKDQRKEFRKLVDAVRKSPPHIGRHGPDG